MRRKTFAVRNSARARPFYRHERDQDCCAARAALRKIAPGGGELPGDRHSRDQPDMAALLIDEAARLASRARELGAANDTD
jgi:hypothetical protein